MSFPTGASEGDLYSTAMGSTYRYFATDQKWVKHSFTGLQGTTGAQGLTGLQGATGLPGPTGANYGSTGVMTLALGRKAGPQIDVVLPFNLRFDGYTFLSSSATGSILAGLWLSDYSNFPPTSANALHNGSTGPNIVAGIKNQVTDLSSWASTTGAQGQVLRVNIDSLANLTTTTLSLNFHKT